MLLCLLVQTFLERNYAQLAVSHVVVWLLRQHEFDVLHSLLLGLVCQLQSPPKAEVCVNALWI